MSRLRLLATLALTSAICLAATPGCSRYGDYCKKRNDCLGGNDKDLAACKDSAAGEEDVADSYGCSSAWDSYTECIEKSGVCKPNPGGKPSYDTEACKQQNEALDSCIKAASAIR